MASTNIEQELAAITAITNALEQLDDAGRKRVIRYVFDQMQLSLGIDKPLESQESSEDAPLRRVTGATERDEATKRIIDIRRLREQKQPSTDVQMVSIVAYYLAELAPPEIRKDSISAADVTEYFKQAGHPLPSEAKYTLANARNAGYLDPLGNGQYKLNPVGHNLVAHKLPRAASDGETKKKAGTGNRIRRKKAAKTRKTKTT